MSLWTATIAALAPAARYALDERTGTTAADSIGTAHGTYAGGYTLWRPGSVAGDNGASFEVDGIDGRASLPSAAALSGAAAITLAFAVYADNPDAAVLNYVLNFSNSGAIRTSAIVGGNLDDGPNFQAGSIIFFNGTNLSGSVAGTFTAAGDGGRWRFIVMRYAAGVTSIWKDGVALSMWSQQVTGTLPAVDAGVIGRRSDGSFPWDGLIDEVMYWGRALTDAEVAQLSNAWLYGRTGRIVAEGISLAA